jgi:hypothetical protein
VSALPPPTFLAAGVVAVVFIVGGIIATFELRELIRGLKGKRLSWSSAGLAIFTILAIPGITAQLFPGGGWPVLLYPLFAAVLFATLTANRPLVFSMASDQIARTLDSGSRVLAVALTALGTIGVFIYPRIPAPRGGGEPQAILMERSDSIGASEHDEVWAKVTCRDWETHGPPAPVCRTIYRVHETADELFIAIVEEQLPCPARPHVWKQWGLFTPIPGCYQRLSKESVPRLEIWSRY